MRKTDKIVVCFFIFLACAYLVFVISSSEGLEDNIFEPVTPKKITDYTTNQLVDIEKERLFEIMADIENYPNIFPRNISHVTILSNVDNVITAEEELTEAGFTMKLTAKHTLNPYESHVIEIIEGDAKGTTITQTFESDGSKTNLITDIHFNVVGPTSIVTYLPLSQLNHAIRTVNSTFAEYTAMDEIDLRIDSLYREILHRPADKASFLQWSQMLRDGQITEDKIRISLLNSEERYFVQLKSLAELSPETKRIITDLYESVLLRTPEDAGLEYFGNILENGKPLHEIRMIMVESNEGRNVAIHHPVRTQIGVVFWDLLDRTATDFEKQYYHEMLDNEAITIDGIEAELKKSEEYKIKNDINSVFLEIMNRSAIWYEKDHYFELMNDGLITIDEIENQVYEYKEIELEAERNCPDSKTNCYQKSFHEYIESKENE